MKIRNNSMDIAYCESGEEFRLPGKVSYIIQQFEENGFEAYAVGGCVRDRLLGRDPEDWDITTDASPQETKKLFSRTADTGIAHGTVTVILEKEGFEVTTYRVDGDYEDGRHPNSVTFTKSLKEDLKRRDFTINAMAFNERDGLVDCFGGREDLKEGIIRCVGDPKDRFSEDALRILRCLRFSAQMGFEIEEETAGAAMALAPTLRKISAERIAAEWTKLLLSSHVDRVRLAWEYGILKQFFPEIQADDRLIAGIEAVRSAASQSAAMQDNMQKYLRYAMLFAGLDAQQAEQMLRRLKFDNQTIHMVSVLVNYKNADIEPKDSSVRCSIHEMGEEYYPLLIEIWKAYAKAGYPDCMPLEQIEEIRKRYEQITARGDCVSLQTLAVKGKDLIAAGIPAGAQMGRILNQLLQEVLAAPEKNEKEQLLALAESFL